MGVCTDGMGWREAAPKDSVGGAGMCNANCRRESLRGMLLVFVELERPV